MLPDCLSVWDIYKMRVLTFLQKRFTRPLIIYPNVPVISGSRSSLIRKDLYQYPLWCLYNGLSTRTQRNNSRCPMDLHGSLSSNSGFPNWQGQTFPGIGNHVPKHRDICSRPLGTRVPCSRISPTYSFQDYLPALSWYIRGVKPVSRLKNLEKADALGKFSR
mgnify:CR=1 FL=1